MVYQHDVGCSFSVILPVYNAAQTLSRTVDSILVQSFRNLELLLVDDGSTDGSGDIADEYAQKDKRLRVWHTENRGPSAARNEALRHIEGDYVVFCDADDWVEPDWLQNFADNMKDNDIAVQGWTYVIGGTCEEHYFDGVSTEPDLAVDAMSSRESFGFSCNKCFRADIIRENNLRYDTRFRFLEDEEFVCRYWTYVKKMTFVHSASYRYVMPDYRRKYTKVDNYPLYISLLSHASQFIKRPESVTLQKYTMGLFRNMLLSFQLRRYAEGRVRLKEVAEYSRSFGHYNRYMQWIKPWNRWIWFPFLIAYCLIKK